MLPARAPRKTEESMPEKFMIPDGMLIIRKEPGYTSSDVVSVLRGILHTGKIGHTGTLDPAAEGVLPVCVGSATKLVDLIADRDKEYRAVLRLGVTTDTEDLTPEAQILSEIPGDEVAEAILRKQALSERTDLDTTGNSGSFPDSETNVARPGSKADGANAGNTGISITGDNSSGGILVTVEEIVRAAVDSFAGEISQVPPMYSAKKVGGVRLYKLAHAGKTIERKPVTVRIHEIEVEKIALPEVELRIVCSKGTYIRSLCRDIGETLGVGGAMAHLVRTRVGMFTLDDAHTIGEIETLMKSGQQETVAGFFLPVEDFFRDYPAIRTLPETDRLLANGNPLLPSDLTEGAETLLHQDFATIQLYEDMTVERTDVQRYANPSSLADTPVDQAITDAAKLGVRYVRALDSTGMFRALYAVRPEKGDFACQKFFR